MKFLATTHISQEITVNKFKGVVANITAGSYLGFSDNELPPKGRANNKVLHISIEFVDNIMSSVLVDIGSSLNVLPKISLAKLTIEGLMMKPNTLVVKAFNCSRRSITGEVDIPIKIGPYTLYITFYVMDIYFTYNCLLGCPCIHTAGAIT